MRLSDDEAWARLVDHDHAVLATTHPERGIDLVPVCFATTHDRYLGVPIDAVKPKAATRLQRERNLAADPAATLLAEQWDRHDWTKLWWVRVQLEWEAESDERRMDLGRHLAQRYEQYRNQPFSRILVFRVVGISGWSGDE